MKKLFFCGYNCLTCILYTSANFEEESVKNFIDSPSSFELQSIKNPITRFCEQTYLEAYMRRDFKIFEKEICGDFFIKKQEEEYLYKLSVLAERVFY